MDHDSTPFDTPAPASHRIADVRATYDALVREGLKAASEEVAAREAYRSNQDGHFAWDISLFTRAATTFARLTGELEYLRLAATWAQHMVERTDTALGLHDWRDRIGPAWSSGPRYTAGAVDLGRNGEHQVNLQAASDRIVIEKPSSTTARVTSIRRDGRTWTSKIGSLSPNEPNYLPDLLSKQSTIHAVLFRDMPAKMDLSFLRAGEYALSPQWAPHFVHTAMISRALISVADSIELTPDGPKHTDILPEELRNAAFTALTYHDEEIRTRAGQPWYITPEDFPARRLGLALPHNQIVDAATSFMLLGRSYRDESLSQLGRALTQPWLKEIAMREEGILSHPWYYYPVGSDSFEGVTRESPSSERVILGVDRGEDSSHGTMRVRALAEWHAIDADLVPASTLRAVSLAFRRNYMTVHRGKTTLRWLPAGPSDPPDDPQLGVTNIFSGAWGALAHWDAPLKRRINSLAYRFPPPNIFGASTLAAAEIVSMNTP